MSILGAEEPRFEKLKPDIRKKLKMKKLKVKN
jgi:hypothetical protein